MNCEQRREFREETEGVEGSCDNRAFIALATIKELDICSILHSLFTKVITKLNVEH
jgi:hypothetical protein